MDIKAWLFFVRHLNLLRVAIRCTPGCSSDLLQYATCNIVGLLSRFNTPSEKFTSYVFSSKPSLQASSTLDSNYLSDIIPIFPWIPSSCETIDYIGVDLAFTPLGNTPPPL